MDRSAPGRRGGPQRGGIDTDQPLREEDVDSDPVVDLECARYHAGLGSRTELVVMNGASHVFILIRRRETAQRIGDFVAVSRY